MDIEILKSIALSIVLGFLIGLERNISFKSVHEKGFAGSRTFALISLIGYISSFLSNYYPFIIYISFFIISLLSITAYFLKVFHYHKQGTTTHFSIIIAFLVGVLVFKGMFFYAIIVTIATVFILNIKSKLKNIESQLSSKDINAAILLLTMTFLILPYLPDKMIFYINPHKTWLMAVIISSLSFLGYIGIKLFGIKYGILITGAAGGFVSSTGVTYTLSKLYKKYKNSLYTYAAAIAIANTIMFARVFVEVLIINKKLSLLIALPYLLTTFFGTIFAIYLYKKENSIISNINLANKNPLELDEAIKFAIIFTIIYSLVYFIGSRYGEVGIYFLSFISGIADVDAITLSLSSMNLEIKTAFLGIVIATISNSLFKLAIVFFFGDKELFKIIFKFFFLILSIFVISNLAVLYFKGLI
ncbi:MgtC/SapB family protein [Caminibacter mediatlanticus TB-2]|uniref:MgtC/SapB family protein n=1 Tax=Caminibacter mediatlanticus TB-2 TaxID=391592 RepID=A0AAI9F0V3_9BACT|nr:MgtC/SapB family protein [Caminibacter mediatlanticus]EDM23057.1 hypothetical protein CMTB2_00394 [Caminibacter mediatlanticus TB-2]QCT94573.1 MgtC/SapB family protein [Caminibacter mediatlanticus TB-2]